MHPRDLRIEQFTYALPDDQVALYPAEERDAARLLIYNDGNISESVYRDIATQIPSGSLMVFNQTKVVYARLLFRKESGSTIEVFCLEPHAQYRDIQTAMLQKGNVLWQCMVGGAKKWKDGQVLSMMCAEPEFELSATMVRRDEAGYTIDFRWSDETLSFAEVLHFCGKVPLPPYIQREASAEDTLRYQTIYAKEEGSVAAPTAGLHFTDRVMRSLKDKEVNTAFVTLHVGAGTFKPVKSATMQEHDMHAEWIEVTLAAIDQLLSHGAKHTIAVGTTSLRTLESLYWIGNKLHNGCQVDWDGIAITQWEPYETPEQCTQQQALEAIKTHMQQHFIDRIVTRTQILIAPGYTFRMVCGLVTNFHQPQSTLLLLVAALIGNDWHKVYDHALANNFRFLSYGDGSLLWKK